MAEDDPEGAYSFRWGIPLLDGDSTVLPNFMLQMYTQIEWTDKDGNQGQGISNTEMMLIIHLASFRYECANGKAAPSLTVTLRERMGYATNQGIINVVESLEFKNLLDVHRERGKRSTYDFTGFSKACMRLLHEKSSTKLDESTKVDGNQSTKIDPKKRNRRKGTDSGESVPKAAKPASKPRKPAEPKETDPSHGALMVAMAEVCHMDLRVNGGRIGNQLKNIKKSSLAPTPELIREKYGGGGWWYQEYWKGKKGDIPKLADVVETWGQWLFPAIVPSGGRNGAHQRALTDRGANPLSEAEQQRLYDELRASGFKRDHLVSSA